MGLVQQAAADILSITTNLNEFGVAIIFTNPLASPVAVATVTGTTKKHHLVFDEFGMPKSNVTTTTCSVSELEFIAKGYTIRNGDGVLDFKKHRAAWADVNGTVITYVVNEWLPNELTGLIVFILGEYGD